MVGRFDVVLNALRRRNHNLILQEISTGNWYRGGAIWSAMQAPTDDPRYNPGLRFAEVEYRDEVYEGTQGFISWIVPNANPGQRLPLYRVSTVQNWVNSVKQYWQPSLVNGQRQ